MEYKIIFFKNSFLQKSQILILVITFLNFIRFDSNSVILSGLAKIKLIYINKLCSFFKDLVERRTFSFAKISKEILLLS